MLPKEDFPGPLCQAGGGGEAVSGEAVVTARARVVRSLWGLRPCPGEDRIRGPLPELHSSPSGSSLPLAQAAEARR